MVSIVIVSHSQKIAEGVKELAEQMSPEVPIEAAGGTCDGRLGTDIEKIISAIEKVYSDDGVLVLFDLGSAFMNAEIALEMLPEEMRAKVEIIDLPLVEGAISASVECAVGRNIEEIKENLKNMAIGKIM